MNWDVASRDDIQMWGGLHFIEEVGIWEADLHFTLYNRAALSSKGAACSQSGLKRSSSKDGAVRPFAFLSNSFASFSNDVLRSPNTEFFMLLIVVAGVCSCCGPPQVTA